MKKKNILISLVWDLLSFLSQLVTLAFQSHVCFSMSNASPEGHVICLSPALVHLQIGSYFRFGFFNFIFGSHNVGLSSLDYYIYFNSDLVLCLLLQQRHNVFDLFWKAGWKINFGRKKKKERNKNLSLCLEMNYLDTNKIIQQ